MDQGIDLALISAHEQFIRLFTALAGGCHHVVVGGAGEIGRGAHIIY
jgi:hypothetical protein